jgi:S1-C subfamily serine protease
MPFITIMLECIQVSSTRTGTGFFINLQKDNLNRIIIITNRHVIKDCIIIKGLVHYK